MLLHLVKLMGASYRYVEEDHLVHHGVPSYGLIEPCCSFFHHERIIVLSIIYSFRYRYDVRFNHAGIARLDIYISKAGFETNKQKKKKENHARKDIRKAST